MSIQLTVSAVDRVKTMLKKRGMGIGIRFGTKVSGCTGFAYVVDYADEVKDNDEVYEFDGIKVLVKSNDLSKVNGTVIDYVKESILSEGFEFNNPNVKDMCGCGESFNV